MEAYGKVEILHSLQSTNPGDSQAQSAAGNINKLHEKKAGASYNVALQ